MTALGQCFVSAEESGWTDGCSSRKCDTRQEWQSDGTKNFIRWERDATKWAGSAQQINRT